MDRLPGAQLLVDLPQDVEGRRVHLRRLVAPPVAEDPVELLQRLAVIGLAALVDDVEPLAVVDVVKGEAAVAGRAGGRRA